MSKPRILIVDDDLSLTALVAQALKQAGYSVREAKNADTAFASIAEQAPDLLLLDISLPGISGLKLLEIIKGDGKTDKLPIIMMTSKKEVDTKVKGLMGGADDYIVKPFDMKELIARVGALMRRIHYGGATQRVREIADVRIDFDRHEVNAQGKQIELTPIEFGILSLLSERPGTVASYQALRDVCRNPDASSETLHVHVTNLRKKLGSAGKRIENVHGMGYKFTE